MRAALRVLVLATALALPASVSGQRINRIESAAPAAAMQAQVAIDLADTQAVRGLVVGGAAGALLGTAATGFACLMLIDSGLGNCEAGHVLLGTAVGGAIGGGIGFLIGAFVPRSDEEAGSR